MFHGSIYGDRNKKATGFIINGFAELESKTSVIDARFLTSNAVIPMTFNLS